MLKITKAVSRGSVLALAISVLSLLASAQEDYRNRPWHTPAASDDCDTIRFTETGLLDGTLPEYLYQGRTGEPRQLVFEMACKKEREPLEWKTLQAHYDEQMQEVKKMVSTDPTTYRELLAHVKDSLYRVFINSAYSSDQSTGLFDSLFLGRGRSAFDRMIPDSRGFQQGKNEMVLSYTVVMSCAEDRGTQSNEKALNPRDNNCTRHTVPMDLCTNGSIRFELRKKDRWTDFAEEHLGNLKKHETIVLLKLDQDYASILAEYDLLQERIFQSSSNNPDTCKTHNDLAEKLNKRIEAYYRVAKGTLADWALQWMWYTKGVPRLNPFLPDVPEPSDPVDNALLDLRIATLRHAISELKLPADYQKTHRSLLDQYQNALELKRRYAAQDSVYKHILMEDRRASFNALYNADTVLYKGILYTSPGGRDTRPKASFVPMPWKVPTSVTHQWMRQHDASRNFSLMPTVVREEYYKRFDKVHYLVHNYTGLPGSVGVKVTDKTTTRPNKATLTEGISTVLTDLNAFSIAGSLSSLIPLTQGKSGLQNDSFLKLVQTVKKDTRCSDWSINQAKLDANMRMIARYDRMLDTVRTVLDIKRSPTRMVPHTEEVSVISGKDFNYVFTVPDPANSKAEKDVNGGTVLQNKPVKVQVIGGVACSLTDVTRIKASGAPVVLEEISAPLQFMVGLKFYPSKGELGDDRVVWSKHRRNIIIAASMPKVADNIYLGGGWDIYPGLNIAAGLQLYRNDVYTILNDKVQSTSTAYSPAAFVAVSLDGSAIVGIATFLFK
jgi:hypothetical protein